MPLRDAFTDGVRALRTTPTLLVAGGCLVGLPLLSLLDVGPQFEPLLSLARALAVPFVLGGFLGMAVETIRGDGSSLTQFVRAGVANYARLLAASVVFLVGLLGLVLLVSGVALVPIAVLVIAGSSDIAVAGAVLGVLLSSVATFLSVPIALLFVQFFAVAIAAEDRGVTGAFTRSARVVRRNLGNALAFSVLWVVAVGLIPDPETLLETGVRWSVPTPGLPAETVSTATLLAVGILSSVALTYCYTVHTAYFLRLSADSAGSGREARATRPHRPVSTQ